MLSDYNIYNIVARVGIPVAVVFLFYYRLLFGKMRVVLVPGEHPLRGNKTSLISRTQV